MTLYDDLGVDKSADKATIKRAYRKRAQKLHPDKPGGNPEKFHAIQKAYDVLYDDARRAHYDAHGVDGQQDRHGDLIRRLAQLFTQLIESQDVDHTDIIGAMRAALKSGKSQTMAAIQGQEQKIKRYESAKKRVKKKGGGDNLLVQMLDGQISLVKRGIELGKAEVQNVEDMTKMLDEYEYTSDSGGRMMQWQTPGAYEIFGNAR